MAIPNSDPWYAAEIVPPNLKTLGNRLATYFGIPLSNIGIRGNPETHFRGYHRSRAFVLNSPWCTNRQYSVTDAVNQTGDPNWVSAIDISLPVDVLKVVCARLDKAVKAGRLEKVVEWYGTLDGRAVYGYDNLANEFATSDPSHLWHLHMSLGRKFANNDHTDIFYILTGEDHDMELTDRVRLVVPNIVGRSDIALVDLLGFTYLNSEEVKRQQDAEFETRKAQHTELISSLSALTGAVNALSELIRSGGGDPDKAALVSAIQREVENVCTDIIHDVASALLTIGE